MWWRWRWQKKKKKGNRKKTELRWLSYGGGGDYLDKKKECWLKWASLYSLVFTGTHFSAHRKAFAFHSNTTASKSLWKLWHFNKRRSGQPGGKRGNCDQMFDGLDRLRNSCVFRWKTGCRDRRILVSNLHPLHGRNGYTGKKQHCESWSGSQTVQPSQSLS